MTSGILYGVGVGPGDPELLTLKAHRIMSTCGVVAYPVSSKNGSMVLKIAGDAVNSEAQHVPIDVPMKMQRGPAQEAYDRAANTLAEHLSAGRDVAFLCEGDPFFYGSYMYVHARLSDRFVCRAIPGVSSLTACAAELGRPLAARNDVLKVLPAPLDDETLTRELAFAQSAVIIKVGRHFERIRALIEGLDLSSAAFVVERAGHEDQKISAVCDVPEGSTPYFSTILIYNGEEPW